MTEHKITKYHNDLNSLTMRGWKSQEMDFFFQIVTQMRDKGTERIVFQKNDLVAASGYTGEHNKRLYDYMTNLQKHVGTLHKLHLVRDGEWLRQKLWRMFDEFEFDFKEDLSDFSLTVRVSPYFQYLLNDIKAQNFTTFEYLQFQSIRSSYAKIIYLHLRQFRTSGWWEVPIDEFKILLSVPDSYGADRIKTKILDISLPALKEFFPGLKCRPIKKKTRGNPIVAYRFSWTPQKTEMWIEGESVQKRQATEKKKKKYRGIPDSVILPDWYEVKASEKATDEDVKKILELQKQTLKK